MAIATVVNVKGEVFAVNKDGVKRRLQKGDQLQEGEVLVTAPGSSAELDMGGGKIVNVAEQQTFAVDGAIGGPAQPNAATSALESAAAAQKVVQALASGDVNALLEAEAAAAGLAGGADSGGSSFVQLLRISEGVTGVNYEFGSFSQGAVDQPTPGAIEEIIEEPTTTNPPTILVGDGELFAESAVAEAFEPALPGGSNEGGLGELVQGQFLVSDPDGVDSLVSITINGTVILMADLVGSVIPGASGMLTITGFDPTTGIATFEYELTAVTTDVDDAEETDVFTFTTTDGTLVSNTATITITIVDDVPTAVVDVADTLVEDGLSFVSGNVLDNDLSGADAPAAFVAWDDSANASTVSALAAYGTLVLNNDGTYSFTLNNSLPAVQALTSQSEVPPFVLAYTMNDADGDPSSATLTINIQGAEDSASVMVAIEGADSTVFEAGLTSVGDTSETDSNDSFQVSATDGIASVTVGGTTFTLAELQAFSVGSPSAGINTVEGTLVITGYSSGDGDKTATISYSYTLNVAQTHTQPGNDTTLTDSVAVSVLGVGGTTANANLTISIIDDVPVFTIVNDGADGDMVASISAPNPDVNTTYNGQFADWKYGADGAQGAPTLSNTSGDVSISSSSSSSLVLDLKDADGVIVGKLTLNADGTDSLEVFHRASTIETDVLLTSDVTASGPSLVKTIISSIEGLVITVTGSDGDDIPNEPNDEVNPSSRGWAVDNNLITENESIKFSFSTEVERFSFAATGFTGSPSNGDVGLSIRVYYTDSIYEDFNVNATDGQVVQVVDLAGFGMTIGETTYTSFVAVEVTSNPDEQDDNDGFRLNNVTVSKETSTPPADLDYAFTLNVVDADGDTVTQSFSVHLDGDSSGGLVLEAIAGTSGADQLVGTSGNDMFIGGAGDDVFQWHFGDQGAGGSPAVDIVADFGNGTDVLDLRDLLQGESSGNLNAYLSFGYDETTQSTVINISSTGHIADGPGAVDQQIILAAVDVTNQGNDDFNTIVNTLGAKLMIDS